MDCGPTCLRMIAKHYGRSYSVQYLRERAFITREGITLEDTVEDLQLGEMYAAYLVRKRNTTEAMPRMLRWALNNRLFSQKSGG